MKIAVTGGKGGTGKSTIATNLAVILARKYSVAMGDLDVECPNDYILLSTKLENEREVKIFKPAFDYQKCVKCGVCKEVCQENAIIMFKNNYPFLLPNICSGCRTCQLACEYNAIKDDYKILGHTYHSKIYGLDLITGVLNEGEERSYPVALATIKRLNEIKADIHIVDTSAGTSNYVAKSLENSDIVIAVTEPTPLGVHDLEMILKLTKKLKLRAYVVVNRADIGEEEIEKISEKYSAEVIYKIPYSEEIIKSYVQGKPIVLSESKDAKHFEKIAEIVEEIVWK